MKKFSLLFALLLLISACQEDNANQDTPVTLESVSGKVTSPSEKPISNALVFYDNQGVLYKTNTNSLGEFEIEVPVGEGKLQVQTGNGKLFNLTVDIDLIKGEPLLLDIENLRLDATANFAYLGGAFDNIEEVVIGLGYTITEIAVVDIEGDNVSNFDALFLNCTGTSVMSDDFYNNLETFVINGGSIYSSDYGLDYLVGKANNASDCTIEPVGGFIPDDLVCGLRTGSTGLLTNNSIVSTDLSNYMNTTTVDLNYDLGAWVQLQNVDSNFWEVLVEDENASPLLIKTNSIVGDNDDSIWYSDNGNQVTICHIPPGNPDGGFEITINVNALAAHLAHGDTIGSCSGNSGNIYYTTFHNHYGDTTPIEIEQIMEYVILNM